MELQHYKTFTENTSQGIVGLLKQAKGAGSLVLTKTKFENSATDYFFVKDDPNYPIFVFKIAKEVNTLIDHEFAVAKDMEELSIYLPHFNRIYEVKFDVRCYIPENNIPENKVKKSSFDPFSQYNCIRDVAIIEYIPSKVTLLQYINDTSFGGSTSSLLYQTFLALFIAQQERRFTHYDLHLENILLRRCLTRTFFLYRFSFENVTMNRLIYTGGYFPVIFDYGFAYSKGLDNHTYKNSFFFTNKGYTSFMYDELTDFKTLLVRLASFDTCPSKIKTVADSLFLKSPITFKLDKETGWIKSSALSAARIVSNKLLETLKKLGYGNSFIYKESDAFIDFFSLLIKLPLEENVERENVSESRWESAVETFLSEWTCIEKWFPDTVVDDKLNILKKIFQTTNNLINQQTPQGSGIDTLIGLADQGAQMDFVHLGQQFKLKLFDIFDMFGAFINVEMNYSKFLSSIVELSNYIEIILHHETRRHSELFEIPLTRWETMVKLEQIFQPTKPHKFEPNDNIVVFDCIEKCVVSFDLKDTEIIASLNTCCTVDAQIELLNSLP